MMRNDCDGEHVDFGSVTNTQKIMPNNPTSKNDQAQQSPKHA